MTAVLPDEVVYHIFSHLDPFSLSRASQCSTAFYRIATSPALWKLPYLLRWSMGDRQRESERGTNEWRRYRKLQRLTLHARRAAAEMGLPSAGTSKSPFHYLQLDKSISTSNPPPFRPDFYRLFSERIRIDQQVLHTLYEQVATTRNRIPAVNRMARRCGSDAKDVLSAIIDAQSSCPSWTPNGLSHEAATKAPQGSDRRKDALAYDTDRCRLSAYQAHLPTTLRSDTHHLSILFHAGQILEHLQRREAMQRMNEISLAARDPGGFLESIADSSDSPCMYLSKQTEIAISLLSMFFGGEITYIEDQLDVLAAACDLYMQQHPAHSFGPTANASALERAKHMALAICDFLADQGFYGARHDLFHDVDNNLLHKCFTTNRQTLPLSLTVIFCGIANRLGMAASLCNFPGCIIAVVMVDPSASIPAPNETLSTAPQEMFWVVVSDYLTKANEAYQPTPSDAFARSERRPHPSDLFLDRAELAQIIRRRGLPPSDEYWRPTRPDAMVRRAVNNVLQSVQNLPAELRDHATRVARDTVRRMEVDRQSRHLRAQWSNLTRVDHAFLSAYHGRTDPVEREKILSRVAKVWDDDTTCAATCIDEDEATWGIVKSWRAESMHTLALMPTEQVMPAMPFRQQLRDYLEARASDNDWTHTIKNLDRRVAEPSDHMEQMAKYAAVNVLMRFGGLSPARNSDLIAGFVQKDFPLDLEVMETDLLGVEHADAEEGAEVGADATSEGSDSSNEATFSSREESYGALPLGGGVLGDSFSPASRMAMARMLQAARMSDRQGQPIRRRRAAETRQEPGQTESPGNASGIREAEDVGTGTAAFRIGTVFRHRTYGYTGHIATWDPHCAAPEDWIVHMGVDRLPAPFEPAAYDSSASSSTPRRGGRHQPFYESITYTSHHGSRRYVAEVNIEPIRGPIWIYGLPPNEARTSLDADGSEEESLALKGALHRVMQDRLFGASFRCFDQARGRFRRSMLTREMFPDDLSDDEDDEEGDGELGALEAESMENLSEDGHW